MCRHELRQEAHVYYPEADAERCTVCLLLDVDSVGMVRGKISCWRSTSTTGPTPPAGTLWN